MLLKFLICSILMCFAVADVKHLSQTYLPPSPQKAIVKSDAASLIAQDVPDLSTNEIAENYIKLDNSDTLTKEASKDPIYGNVPFGYNSLTGGFPSAFPNQGFAGPIYPRPVFPPQGFPGQGLPGQGFVNPGLPPQGFPGPILPGQSFPGQNFPGQGFPAQGFPGQGFPGQVFPGQVFPGQGFSGQVFPGQGFINPGFSGQGYPNYPTYFSELEQLKKEANNYNEADKLRLRVTNTDTEYDATNGGYLYNKPSVTF